MASLAAAIASANRIMQCMGPVSHETRTTIVKRQCEIVLAQITAKTGSVFVEADIVEALSNSVFPAEEKSRLLEAVAIRMSGSGSVASSQKFQNYTSLIHFIPRALVPHVGRPQFMLMFCKFLAEQLHLRKPSEFTYKEMAIIVSLAEGGPEKTMQKNSRRAGLYPPFNQGCLPQCYCRPRHSEHVDLDSSAVTRRAPAALPDGVCSWFSRVPASPFGHR